MTRLLASALTALTSESDLFWRPVFWSRRARWLWLWDRAGWESEAASALGMDYGLSLFIVRRPLSCGNRSEGSQGRKTGSSFDQPLPHS